MSTPRREFLRHFAAAGLAGGTTAAASAAHAAEPARPAADPLHDMSAFPAHWTGQEQIAMLLYPEFTALDLVGPQYMLANLMGAKVHLVARSLDPVRSDTGITIVPTMTLEQVPQTVDILFVPGGSQGTLNAMKDTALVAWLADRGSRARLLASVCTGSLLLGMAGLLRGRRATSHWATHALLPEFGATAVDERVVWDGRLVTGAGVSAGLDLGLAIVAKVRDDTYAQSVQLLAEYAPRPPFDAGTPGKAPKAVYTMMSSMFDSLVKEMRATARQALPARAPG
jgi:cyclohexyl-isocyanide hydratase